MQSQQRQLRHSNTRQLILAGAISGALSSVTCAQVLTPEQRAGAGGQVPNPSPIAYEEYVAPISLGQSTTRGIVGAVYPDKASLSWYKFTSDGVSPIIFDTYGTSMAFSLGGFGARNGGELAVYDVQGHYIAGNEGSQKPASGDSNIPPVGTSTAAVTTRQPINPTLAVNANDPGTGFRNDQNLANLAFVKNPESNPRWNSSHPQYTPQANWNQFSILPAGTYFLAVTGFSTYFSGFARDASEIDKPSNAVYTNGITSTTPFGFLTFHAYSGTFQLNARLAGDFDQNGAIQPADIRLLRLQSAYFKPSAGIATAGFLGGNSANLWVGLPNNPSDPSVDLQRYDLTGNARIDLFDVAAWGRYTDNPTTAALVWNNTAAAPGTDPLNPGTAGNGTSWDLLSSQNFQDASGSQVFLDGDTVTFNDDNNGNYAVNLVDAVHPAAVIVSSAGSYSISGTGAIGGTGGLTKTGAGALILATSNSYTGSTTVSGGTLTLADTGKLSPTGALSVNTAKAVIAPAVGSGVRPRSLASITITGGGSVLLEAPVTHSQRTVLKVGTISIVSGKLDIANNDLIVTSTPMAAIASLLATGFNGSNWGGAGLTSSIAQADATSAHKTAIGYGTATSINTNIFDGLPVNATDVLIRFTYSGDANLDGIVNSLDFNSLATNFGGGSGKFWVQADFNYDGLVTSLDFTELALNFNQSLPLAAPSATGAIVPEPSAVFMLSLMCGMNRRGSRMARTRRIQQ